jgi:hypothetical protein
VGQHGKPTNPLQGICIAPMTAARRQEPAHSVKATYDSGGQQSKLQTVRRRPKLDTHRAAGRPLLSRSLAPVKPHLRVLPTTRTSADRLTLKLADRGQLLRARLRSPRKLGNLEIIMPGGQPGGHTLNSNRTPGPRRPLADTVSAIRFVIRPCSMARDLLPLFAVCRRCEGDDASP